MQNVRTLLYFAANITSCVSRRLALYCAAILIPPEATLIF
jgi:hypothetical protein